MAGAAPEGAAALVGVLNKVMKYAVGLGVGASILQTSLYNGRRNCSSALPAPRLHQHHRCIAVDGGERAVIFDRFRGVLAETVGEGTHFRIPFIQDPNIMDIRTRAKTISSVTGTKGRKIETPLCVVLDGSVHHISPAIRHPQTSRW